MDARTDLVVIKAAEPAAERFDRVSMALHWATAALVGVQLATAFLPHGRDLLMWHRSMGTLTLAVVIARLAWRARFARAPSLPRAMNRPARAAAHANAYGLYGLLLLQPLTGLGDAIFHGRPFVLFGLTVPALAPMDKPLFHMAGSLHETLAWGLIGLIGLHVAAALMHGLVLKDGVLQRMLPARR